MLKLSFSVFFAVVSHATSKDIVQTATEYDQLQSFTDVLSAANLLNSLSESSGPFTVLAPNDNAFANLPDGFVACLLQPINSEILVNILEYHILSGNYFSNFLLDGWFYDTLNDQKVSIHRSTGIEINDSTVITPDVRASNGVIHIIDTVLLPSDIDVNKFLETCQDIPETIIENGNFNWLAEALDAADLSGMLSKPAGPFTLFAPLDEAFTSLPDGLFKCLLKPENKGTLTDILEYHIVEGKVCSDDLSHGMSGKTLNGDDVDVDLSDGIKINDSNMVTPDIRATNGIIHAIDSVLIPSDIDIDIFLDSCRDIPQIIIAKKNFETLVEALGKTNSMKALSGPAGPFTVFAPTDEAFRSLPNGLINCLFEPDNKDTLAEILLYHIIQGKVFSNDLSDGMAKRTLNGNDLVVDKSDGFKVDYSIVSIPDIAATNGVLHVIDAVLIPFDIDVNTLLSTCRNIPETAIENGNFGTLVAALDAADLVDTLSQPASSFTLFAPTDNAFASLPNGFVACLLKPSNKNILLDILKYHVLEGKVMSGDLSNYKTATTLNGDDVAINFSGSFKIDYSIVSIPDVEASNGVIHAIDAVLIPSSMDVNEFITSCQDIPGIVNVNENVGTLATLLDAADLVDALSEPAGPFTLLAPSDEAFAKLPYGLVNCLLEPSNTDSLLDLLKYHIVEGKVLLNYLSGSMTAETLNGNDVVIDLSNGLHINDSIVSIPNIEARNGIIHVLDDVLIPPDININALLAACQEVPDNINVNDKSKTLGAALTANINLQTLVTALGTADLIEDFSKPDSSFTVFAPTDKALSSLPNGMVSCLLKPDNKDTLVNILKYHIVEGKILSSQSGSTVTAETLNGNTVTVDLSYGKVNDYTIFNPDIEASNGVIHVIQSVLLPPDFDIDSFLATCRGLPETITENGNFDTLLGVLEFINLADVLSESTGSFTLFAPTDEAFTNLPDGMLACLIKPENMDVLDDILEYHFVEGHLLSSNLKNTTTITTLNGGNVVIDFSNGFEINDSIVSTPDLEASNGVIHGIDSVLIPSNLDVNIFLATCQDIPETASANGNFETFVTALGAADLLDDLTEPSGPFTVFAPIDGAFDSLPPGFMSCLFDPLNKDTLIDVLKYHIVQGKVLLSDLTNIETVVTMNGEIMTVSFSDGVKINDSFVSISDVEASNGVMHVIDSVLIPPNVDINNFANSCGRVTFASSSKESFTPSKKKVTYALLLLYNLFTLL